MTAPSPTSPPPSTEAGRVGEAAQRAHDNAVLDAWRNLKVVDQSPAAQQIRQETAEIRRRRRPAPADNPYTGTIDPDELGLVPQYTYQEYADHYRHSAERFDDNNRDRPSDETADNARWFHAAADVLDERVAAAGGQAKHWGRNDDAAYRQRQRDDIVLARAQELDEFDETPAAEQARRDAEQIMQHRRQMHTEAVDRGVPPCPAAWSRDTPCLNPAGDGHVDWCFSEDGETWPRAISYFTPEAKQSGRRAGQQVSPSESPGEPRSACPAPDAPTQEHASAAGGGGAGGGAGGEAGGGLGLNGEVYGLNASIFYVANLSGLAAEHGTAGGEGYIGHLTRSKVSGAALTRAHEMQEAFATAAAAAERHAVELIKQRNVQEAYDQAPDAGNKGYLLDGR